VRGSTALALTLYRHLGSGDDNLVASPSSLATVLAMALPGARGRTADEIAHVLHTTLDPGRLAVAMGILDAEMGQRASAGNGAELRVSNALWSQRGYTIRPAFLELLAGAFRSGVHQADFIADAERAPGNQRPGPAADRRQDQGPIRAGIARRLHPPGADQRDLPEGPLAAALRPARHPTGAVPGANGIGAKGVNSSIIRWRGSSR